MQKLNTPSVLRPSCAYTCIPTHVVIVSTFSVTDLPVFASNMLILKEMNTTRGMVPMAPKRATAKSGTIYIPSASSNRSYVVVLSIWEQLLGASKNFLHLQCWTKSLDVQLSINTVEPCIKINRSRLGFSFAQANTLYTNISLSNVFDMGSWHKLWPHNAGALAPIISRDDFITEITRFNKKIILVQFVYMTANVKLCEFSWNTTTLMKDLEYYHRLTVARRVCINLQNPLSSAEFKDLIIGDDADNSVQNTIVIFKEWRGIGPGRTTIRFPSCSREVEHGHILPSKRVLKDAEVYANHYLGGFGQYISVSARFEKVSLHYSRLSLVQKRHEVDLAIKESMIRIGELKKRTSVKRVYLTYDFGQFGSRTFLLKNFYNSSDMLVKFQQDVYEGRMSPSEYEQSFMTFRHRNPGYVAMVQMTISSRGKCLLRVGWGHCINFVTSLFRSNHVQPFCLACAPHSICNHM